MLGDGMVLALLPQKVISLTDSSLFVGYLASTYALAQVISQLPIGILADRLGSKLFILMGYILSFFAGLLFYFTNSVNLIFCGRVLQGIGEAPILSLAPALLSLQYSTNKGKAIGVYNASIYLGLTVGPLLRIVLLKEWSDSQIFLFYAVLCSIGAIINGCSLKNKKKEQVAIRDTINLKSALVFMKHPQTLAVLFGITLYGAGFGIFMTIIPAYLLIVKHYNQTYINVYFSIFYIAISLAQVVTGWLSDKLGRQLFMLTGMLVAALGLGTSSYFGHFALTVILGLSSFGLGTYYLASMAFLNEKAPESCRGVISGLYYLFWGIGMFWGPLLLADYIQGNTYQSGFRIFSLALIIQVILLFITRIRYFQPTREISQN